MPVIHSPHQSYCGFLLVGVGVRGCLKRKKKKRNHGEACTYRASLLAMRERETKVWEPRLADQPGIPLTEPSGANSGRREVSGCLHWKKERERN